MFEFDLLTSPPNTPPLPLGICICLFFLAGLFPALSPWDSTASNKYPPPGLKGWTCPGGCPGGWQQVKLNLTAMGPATVFCKLSVWRSKYCLEFSIIWGRLKIPRWPFRSCTIFEAYLTNSLRFLKFNFYRFTPLVRLFFVRKREPKIFWFKKCDGERNSLS